MPLAFVGVVPVDTVKIAALVGAAYAQPGPVLQFIGAVPVDIKTVKTQNAGTYTKPSVLGFVGAEPVDMMKTFAGSGPITEDPAEEEEESEEDDPLLRKLLDRARP